MVALRLGMIELNSTPFDKGLIVDVDGLRSQPRVLIYQTLEIGVTHLTGSKKRP
jgi:hypothetical protein